MKFVILILLLLQCSLVFSRKIKKTKVNAIDNKKIVIIGAGPVGLYTALKLLMLSKSVIVTIYHNPKSIFGPQTVRIPFIIAKFLKDLPELTSHRTDLGKKMWTGDSYNFLFKDKISSETKPLTHWPYMISYDSMPLLNIKLFCQVLKDYLVKTFTTQRFIYEKKKMTMADVKLFAVGKVHAIFVATGLSSLSNNLRMEIGQTKSYTAKINNIESKEETRGINIIYKNTAVDNFKRDKKQDISVFSVSDSGLTYGCSNNVNFDVHLYTFPIHTMDRVFNNIVKPLNSDELKEVAKFPLYLKWNENWQQGSYDTSPTSQPTTKIQNLKPFLDYFKVELQKIIADHGIVIPTTGDVRLLFAERSEKFFKENYGDYKLETPSTNTATKVPVFFVGDSAGTTEYKLGLNLGRGLFGVDIIVEGLEISFHEAKLKYQQFWKEMIEDKEKKEFAMGRTTLGGSNWLIYKYVIMGRKVNGVFYENSDKDYQKWVGLQNWEEIEENLVNRDETAKFK